MNLKHLYYFWKVAKLGGVVRAAEAIHISPQTLSGQIKLLEARLGAALFVRQGRSLELTDAGRLALEYADDIAPEDVVFEGHGVKVLIDPKSLPYIDGTELDFVREGLNEGFKFHNPREKDRCGCGESFRV